ncbi:uncharacterized protein B0P05DRAFT_465474, partial [Gilbertella persicaria]|uniref:uncharacterized protein n=1 Tax=Gilbertella persicaria TaxID=101096 RepID=UPI0022208681
DLSKITFEAENELEESLENVCKTMISPRSRINERSEASFFNQYLMPFMNEVVLEGTGDDTVYSLPACKSVYQEENDFVKLLKMMKASIDYQITLGIRNPKSFGLLCFSCSFYQMTLLEEGLYISTCLRRFQLVKSQSMILNVIPAIEVFRFIKV